MNQVERNPKMNESLCSEFIRHLDRNGDLGCDAPPVHIENWISDLRLPVELSRFLLFSWPQKDCKVADINIHSSASIYADEATAPLLKDKFFNAGWATSGDWFVVDFSNKDCIPGFIAQCEWNPWLDKPVKPRKFFQPIARSLDSLLFRITEGLYVPADYYAAKDFSEFLAKEQQVERSASDTPIS